MQSDFRGQAIGMVEVESGFTKLFRVPNETKRVTNFILKRVVAPGTTIVSDAGGAFFDVEHLMDDETEKQLQYKHEVVNHSGNMGCSVRSETCPESDQDTPRRSIPLLLTSAIKDYSVVSRIMTRTFTTMM